MDLYFTPMTCSLASRIALYEAGLDAQFHHVNLAEKLLSTGGNYLDINPKGQVPAFRTDDHVVITEGPAILQHIADLAPESGLAPPAGTPERTALQSWLNFIASELHKAVFYTIFHPESPPEAKAFVRDTLLPSRYRHVSDHLANRDTLMDRFTVADAYLFTTLNWAKPAGVKLSDWPTLTRYHQTTVARPAVDRAMSEEMALYMAA